MRLILNCIIFLFDILIPRFITEDVALVRISAGHDWDSYEIECAMVDVEEGERFDAIASVDAFTWLGMGVTYRVLDFREWIARH